MAARGWVLACPCHRTCLDMGLFHPGKDALSFQGISWLPKPSWGCPSPCALSRSWGTSLNGLGDAQGREELPQGWARLGSLPAQSSGAGCELLQSFPHLSCPGPAAPSKSKSWGKQGCNNLEEGLAMTGTTRPHAMD